MPEETGVGAPERTAVSRRRFLRQLMTTVGLGLGLVVVSAQPAFASQCCRDSSCPNCPGTPVKYKCTDNCGGGVCCICHANVGQCFTTGCIC